MAKWGLGGWKKVTVMGVIIFIIIGGMIAGAILFGMAADDKDKGGAMGAGAVEGGCMAAGCLGQCAICALIVMLGFLVLRSCAG